jgi:serine/threonine-protein kinase
MGVVPEAFGPYLVYEQLGIGGMAEVHRAEQSGIEGFRKIIALKRMLPHVAENEDMVRSFVREGRLAAYLRHANVAQTYELGKVGEIYFIAMELIDGRNLREILRNCAHNRAIMPVRIALNVINQICDALDYAHNLCDHEGQPLGIIHRDVSPSNVIVAEGGIVKLIDFGIAKAEISGMQTMSGTIKGKFGYMAPEYIGGTIDARADLFAVGVIAHELLTNQPLFTSSDDIDTLQRVRSMEIDPPSRSNPKVPPEIDDIVMTALARDPDMRWQHATALRAAMTTVTKRLGLDVMSSEVAEWLDTTFFDSATLPFGSPYPYEESVSISIETLQPLPTLIGRTSTQKMTLSLKGTPPATLKDTPVGTPVDSIPAESSIPPNAPLAATEITNNDYRIAVAQFERHDALVPSGSFLADEIVPTMVRAAPAPGPVSQRIETQAVTQPIEPLDIAHDADAPKGSGLVAVVLVLLAAAVAATAVYFLLPLLT